MTAKQLLKFLARLTEHGSGFMGLTTEEADWWIKKTARAVGICVEALKKEFIKEFSETPWKKRELLRLIEIITIPTTKEEFYAHSRFLGRGVNHTGTLVSPANTEISEWFQNDLVMPRIGTDLDVNELLLVAATGEIFKTIGLGASGCTKMRDVFWLVDQQPEGQPGKLSSVDHNLFFIRDGKGTMRVVCVQFDSRLHFWKITAYDPQLNRCGRSDEWAATTWAQGTRVFVRRFGS